MEGLKSWLKRYGSVVFVVVGLAAVGLTVLNVQTGTRLFSRAAGEEEAKAAGVWFESNPVTVNGEGRGETRLKLQSLEQEMKSARLVFNYDPKLLKIDQVRHGSVFEDVTVNNGEGQLVLNSGGSFYGTGTWVILDLQLLTERPAMLVAEEGISRFEYKDGKEKILKMFDVRVERRQ